MPAGDGIVFKYGDYSFDPRPLFTVNKEAIKTASLTGLATKYTVSLEGNIIPTGIDPIGGNKAGLTEVLSGAATLRDAFAHDFQLLYLQCNTSDALISGYPKVNSINVTNSSDNYIKRADYTIELEMPSLTGGFHSDGLGIKGPDGSITGDFSSHGLISLSDEFTVEFANEQIGGTVWLGGDASNVLTTLPPVFSIQRSLSAQGNPVGSVTGYVEPWKIASGYVISHLGITPEMTGLHNLLSLSGLNVANNYRTITVNKTEGTVDAVETFITYTGSNPALEDFEVSIERSQDSPFTTIDMNGTVQGLSTLNYSANPVTGVPKIVSALNAWSGVGGISGALPIRAQTVYNNLPKRKVNMAGSINTDPLAESIGYNLTEGIVSYSYSYDDRPINCYTGALNESISFTYNQPNDVFASLVILGRSRGPLFQAINTSGAETRDLSIDAIIPVQGFCNDLTYYTGAPIAYADFLAAYETQLGHAYDQIFTNSFTQTWEPKVGHFTLNKSWTLGKCPS
jgi:hypothetical protein